MRVAIIDSKAHRAEAIKEVIQHLGHNVSHLERPWGSGIAPPLDWELLAQEKVDGVEVIFLHVGEDQFPDGRFAAILGRCYGRQAVICYSGADIREEFESEIGHHEKWCAYKGGATVPLVGESLENRIKTIESYEWDLSGYFEAVENGLPDACERLNSIDPFLEAELHFLYKGLEGHKDGDAASRIRVGFAEVEDAARKRTNERPELSEMVEARLSRARQVFAAHTVRPDVCTDGKPEEHVNLLLALRDALLGE